MIAIAVYYLLLLAIEEKDVMSGQLLVLARSCQSKLEYL